MILHGGTVADLRKYIENNGGRVVGVTTLATGCGSTILLISKETQEQIERKFGRDEIEQFLEEYNIAGGIEALTESEAQFLNRWDSLDTLRKRIAEGGFEGKYDGGEIGEIPEDFAEDGDRTQGINAKPNLKRDAGAVAPIFYSQLRRVIEQKMPSKAIAKEGLLRYQNTLKVDQKGWTDKIKKSLDVWDKSRLQLPGGPQTLGSNDIVLTENDYCQC